MKTSLAFEPLNTSVSVPLPPSMTSLPSPGFQISVSFSSPPSRRSLVLPLVMVSLPGPPCSVATSVKVPLARPIRMTSLPPMASTEIVVNVARRNEPTTAAPSSTSIRVASPATTRTVIWLSSPSPLMVSVVATTFAVTAASARVAGKATAAARNSMPEEVRAMRISSLLLIGIGERFGPTGLTLRNPRPYIWHINWHNSNGVTPAMEGQCPRSPAD